MRNGWRWRVSRRGWGIGEGNRLGEGSVQTTYTQVGSTELLIVAVRDIFGISIVFLFWTFLYLFDYLFVCLLICLFSVAASSTQKFASCYDKCLHQLESARNVPRLLLTRLANKSKFDLFRLKVLCHRKYNKIGRNLQIILEVWWPTSSRIQRWTQRLTNPETALCRHVVSLEKRHWYSPSLSTQVYNF